jgi:hypothetical protein
MTDQTLATEQTVIDTASQETAKTYTQAEVDALMAKTRSSVEHKVSKKYDGLGDPEYLKQLVQSAEQQKQEEAVKRGEFETILKELANKKDAEISKRDAIIQDYKVNTPILSAASQLKAVNAEQVKTLLQGQVRLNGDGEVEVVDSKGTVRYTDNGSPLGVQDLVQEFLQSNPHFVQPTPATTNTKSSHSAGTNTKLDISQLDMANPAHRKLYAEAKAEGKL